MKTALQQLDQIIGTSPDKIPLYYIKRKIQLLLKDEKKQIISAFKCGNTPMIYGRDPEKYYNDTFNK
jgi:hypothetical protein